MEMLDLEMLARRPRAYIGERLGEQTAKIQSYFAELVKSLAREHNSLFTDERGLKGSFTGLPPELQQPIASVDESRDALLRILRRTQL